MNTTMDGWERLEWLTLTEAAARSGHSRAALRQRVRRGTLYAQKGNDGQLRVRMADVDELPPPGPSADDQGDATTAAAVAVLRETVDDLRDDLERMRSALDAARADQLVDRGRAERAEAQADAAEARARMVEAALVDARTPWLIRVIKAVRGV